MGAFGGLILTNKGRNLQAKAQAGATLNFTKVKMGDGDLGGQSIADLIDLISPKQDLSITSMETLTDGKAKLKTYFTNSGLESGFYWKELGVFTQDPDEGEILYCYGNAGGNAEYIPANPSGGSADLVERYLNIITLVGNASSVTATLGSEIYVTQADMDNHLNVLNPHEITSAMIGAETPDGAQAKADAAEASAATYAEGLFDDLAGAGRTTETVAGNKSLIGTLTNLLTTAKDNLVNAVNEIYNSLTSHLADYVLQIPYATATGTANTYAVTLDPAPTSYVAGMAIAVKINVDNTGASTINVNGLGTKTIKKPNGNDVAAGNLKAGSVYTLRFNGTNFILQGSDAAGNAIPDDVLAGKTFTNDYGEQTGTMPNRTTNQWNTGVSKSGNTLMLKAPYGYYNGSIYVKHTDDDWVESNIVAGKNIFGKTGNYDKVYGSSDLIKYANLSGAGMKYLGSGGMTDIFYMDWSKLDSTKFYLSRWTYLKKYQRNADMTSDSQVWSISLEYVRAIAVDSNDYIYCAYESSNGSDTKYLRKHNSSGSYVTQVTISTNINEMRDILRTPNDSILVHYNENDGIGYLRKYTTSLGVSFTLSNISSRRNNVDFDNSSNIYCVSSDLKTLYKYNSSGTLLDQYTTTDSIYSIAVDRDTQEVYLWIYDDKIRKISPDLSTEEWTISVSNAASNIAFSTEDKIVVYGGAGDGILGVVKTSGTTPIHDGTIATMPDDWGEMQKFIPVSLHGVTDKLLLVRVDGNNAYTSNVVLGRYATILA